MKQWFFICVIEKLIKKYKEDGKAQESFEDFAKLLEQIEHDDPKEWLSKTAKLDV